MQVEARTEEVHTYGQKFNEYENGRLTVAKQEIIKLLLDQMNTMKYYQEKREINHHINTQTAPAYNTA